MPFKATAEGYVARTAASDAKEAIRPAEIDADPMTAIKYNDSAKRAPPSVSALVDNDTEMTREVEPTFQRKHTVTRNAGKNGLQFS